MSIDLDQDIVAGFATDSSNLPGYASALARPACVRECAVLLRACSSSRIPVTLSAGRLEPHGQRHAASGLVISLSAMHNPVSCTRPPGRSRAPWALSSRTCARPCWSRPGASPSFPSTDHEPPRCHGRRRAFLQRLGLHAGREGIHEAVGLRYRVSSSMNGLQVRAERGQVCFRGTEGRSRSRTGRDNRSRAELSEAVDQECQRPVLESWGRVDLVDLIVGSEGIFGPTTHAAWHCQGIRTEYLDLFISLPDETDALGLLSHLSGAGPSPFPH